MAGGDCVAPGALPPGASGIFKQKKLGRAPQATAASRVRA